MATLKKKAERSENDYYPTPEDAIQSLFDVINFDSLVEEGWTFAEPCKGISGAIYKHFPEYSEYSELSEGKDYFETEWKERPDCIITNPPFSMAVEFLEKSLQESDVCIYLLRLGFLESVKRREFHQEHLLDHLVVLSKRPSFTGDGKTDGTGYAWYIYDPSNKLGLTQPFYVV